MDISLYIAREASVAQQFCGRTQIFRERGQTLYWFDTAVLDLCVESGGMTIRKHRDPLMAR